MSVIDPNARRDPFIHEVKEKSDAIPVQLLNATVPFLLMGRLTAKPVSFALSTYQIGMGLYQMKRGDRKQAALSLAHTAAHTALTYFKPTLAPLYSTLTQMAAEFRQGCDAKTAARLANHTLFLASLLVKRPEILAASLLAQAAMELKEAHSKYEDGNRIEAIGKLLLALVRAFAGVKQVEKAYDEYRKPTAEEIREQIWNEVEGLKTGLTRAELEAIMNYADHHERTAEAIRIKGTQEGLPRSITLTPDSLYIHLKKKGGMEPLGGGAFKTAYTCVKIDHGHAKLMAELTVRHTIQMALKEDQLARDVGSKYISGGAEVALRYGTKLCLIQELMDMDGWHYAMKVEGSAADRLRVMEEVARGLGDLHTFGYSHGDLHSGNFLVNVRDGEHHAKLSDLGLARKMPEWDNQSGKWDVRNLAELVGTVCSPVWNANPEDEGATALKEKVAEIIQHPHHNFPTAYEIADQLRECRIRLGETGTTPLPAFPGRGRWETSGWKTGTTWEASWSPDTQWNAFILHVLHELGFSFETVPSTSVLQNLSIRSSDLRRVFGISSSMSMSS